MILSKTGRNSIGIEIDPQYCEMALTRLQKEHDTLFADTELEMQSAEVLLASPTAAATVADGPRIRPKRSGRARKNRP